MNTSVPTKFWHKLPNGRIQCDVCPRDCQLEEGQKGFCFIRERQNDQVVLTAYGQTSGMAIDPIEKKPLYHFLPGSQVLSFGTIGCNLNCLYCQNWNISKARQNDPLRAAAKPAEIVALAREKNIPSVAFTYNEPTVFLEYAVDVAKACHGQGIRTVAVTNGYINPSAREEMYAHIDAANIDLKSFSEGFYKKVCGGTLEAVLDTLIYVKNETKTWLEVTNLLIPGENDSAEEIHKMTEWIIKNLGADVPLHFSAFHPDWKMTDKIPTPPRTLFQAKAIAEKNGLRFVYTGNIRERVGSTTFCPNCKTPLIERGGFRVTSVKMDDTGRCRECREQCPGIYN